MAKLFGTDGIRGIANRQLTPELAFRLGRAGGYVLALQGGMEPGIVIGKDTRISGDMLEAALTAGICSVGVDVYHLGVLPTPGVAYLTKALNKPAGAVISASHNPFGDNGIKFLGPGGSKLSDAIEEKIEALVEDIGSLPYPTGAGIGRVYQLDNATERYGRYAKSLFRGSLKGLKIVVDCSNGAACRVTPQVLADLGAEVVTLFAEPDGTNINCNCGSTHTQALQKAVVAEQAHLGLAHDGDADRVLAVDEKGQLVDGDQIMVITALAMKQQGSLAGNKIVVTVMSNLGLRKAMERAGIEVLETKVGDRYVLEKMLETGAVLGGEQSGHIIFLEQNNTGDGLITALNLLQVMVDTQKPLSVLAAQMERFPQVTANVTVTDKEKVLKAPALVEELARAETRLKGRGRILVRPSGTEPLIRLMAEGPDEGELKEIIAGLSQVVREAE
ncbi:MAG: phosphoglucosamine mutase [Clostridia bacterium]|nr:phosphoglucosamine mutase [Clostridia bacterium]